jgi:hypothetical protein
MLTFEHPETVKQFECTLVKDQSVIVLQSDPVYRGKVSLATPEACEQMIKEGIPFIKRKTKV